MSVPEIRIRQLNNKAVRSDGDYVLYWMVAHRRTRYNFSLQRAVELSKELNKPLVVLEALRCEYEWASDRLHRFVLQGMQANRESLKDSAATYYCYVEPEADHGTGLLKALAAKACAVVTDDFPCFFIPRCCSRSLHDYPSDWKPLIRMVYCRCEQLHRFIPPLTLFVGFYKELPSHLDQTPQESTHCPDPDLPDFPSCSSKFSNAGRGHRLNYYRQHPKSWLNYPSTIR